MSTPRPIRRPGWAGDSGRVTTAMSSSAAAPTTAAAPPAGTAAPVRWLLALGVGVAVGALTSPAQTLLGSTVLSGLTNAVGPWLLAPFLVAAWARSTRSAVLVGVLACTAQVAGYYLVSAARGFGVAPAPVAVWLVAGVVGGAVLGLAGRSWRTGEGRERGLGLAVLVAAWLAEAVVLFGVVLGHPGQAAVAGGVGVLLLLVLGSHRRQHLAAARWLLPAVAAGALGFGVLLALL